MGKRTTRVVGVFGLGETSVKNIKKNLDDLIGDDADDYRFILPATKTHLTESLDVVIDFLETARIPYEVVTDDTSGNARGSLRALLKDAEEVHKADDVGAEIVALLKEEDDAQLLLLWDETLGEGEDGGAYNTAAAALAARIPTKDMCNGLEPFEPDDDEADTTAAADSVDAGGGPEEEEKEETDPVAQIEGLPPFKEAQKLGIRALRALARDNNLAPSRTIGGMSMTEVLSLLYPNGDAGVAARVSGGGGDGGGKVKAAKTEQLELELGIDDQVAAAARSLNGGGASALAVAIDAVIRDAIRQAVRELQDA